MTFSIVRMNIAVFLLVISTIQQPLPVYLNRQLTLSMAGFVLMRRELSARRYEVFPFFDKREQTRLSLLNHSISRAKRPHLLDIVPFHSTEHRLVI